MDLMLTFNILLLSEYFYSLVEFRQILCLESHLWALNGDKAAFDIPISQMYNFCFSARSAKNAFLDYHNS